MTKLSSPSLYRGHVLTAVRRRVLLLIVHFSPAAEKPPRRSIHATCQRIGHGSKQKRAASTTTMTTTTTKRRRANKKRIRNKEKRKKNRFKNKKKVPFLPKEWVRSTCY